MKVFISADIEGVAAICHPDEANPSKSEVRYFQEQMTAEVAAACRGAIKAGAKEILVKDAHWTGRNIDAAKLPESARLLRGWSGHPFCMMDGLDESFDAAMMIGYHARAGSGGNPLAHTLSGRIVEEIRLNGVAASEFLLNYYTALSQQVAVVFCSGDQALCDEIGSFNESIATYAPIEGRGPSVTTRHPAKVVREIEVQTEAALANLTDDSAPLPSEFSVELDFKMARLCYGASFYPGCERLGEKTLRYQSRNYLDILTMIKFTTAGSSL